MLIRSQDNMNVFDVLREKFNERHTFYKNRFAEMGGTDRDVEDWGSIKSYADAIEIVNQVEQEFVPKTNADRIRAMSDEELAKFLSCTEKNLEIRIGLTRGILDWLKQEVVDD